MRFELGTRVKLEAKDVRVIFLCFMRYAHILEVVLVFDKHGLFDFAVMHSILLGISTCGGFQSGSESSRENEQN